MLGWLSTLIETFEDAEYIKAKIHFVDNGLRPWIELEPTEHPFAVCQREGISAKQVGTVLEYYLHRK